MKQKKEKNRKRCYTISFRVSPIERDELYSRIRLSGKTKQDYMIKSMLYQKIVVVGNNNVFNELKTELKMIGDRLKNIDSIKDIEEEKVFNLKTILEIIKGL